jgi:uncharacterized membrane protein
MTRKPIPLMANTSSAFDIKSLSAVNAALQNGYPWMLVMMYAFLFTYLDVWGGGGVNVIFQLLNHIALYMRWMQVGEDEI